MKGNIMDLAVAVIIGAALGKIVTALVANTFTPLIWMASGGIDIGGLKATVGSAELTYGVFIQALIDLIIVSFCISLIVRDLNKVQAAVSGPEEEPTPEKTPEDIELLREICDTLKKKSPSSFRAPPKTSCGLELDKIPAVFVAKAPTITR
jgi:large conductance mechanosensitive channel